MRAVHVLATAAAGLWLAGAADTENPAYWANRIQQASLPLASMRADVEFETRAPRMAKLEERAQLVRVKSYSKIRSVLKFEPSPGAPRVIKLSSNGRGGLDRVLYSGDGEVLEMKIRRSDRFERTAFRYEDLGFVDQLHLKDATVEELDFPSGRVIRLTTKPYGPYGKVVLRVNPETAIPSQIEYFDRRGLLERTVTYSEVDQEGVFRFPLRMEAVEVGTGRRSVARFQTVKVGVDVYDYEFSDLHLRRVLRDLRKLPTV